MAAERSFLRTNLRFAAAGAVVVASSLAAFSPAWSGPVADANVIVDLSVIDNLGAVPRTAPPIAPQAADWRTTAPITTSRLHVGAPATGTASTLRSLPATGDGAGRAYGRLIPDWPPRTAAQLRSRSVTPVRPLTRKAAHLLAHVEPAPRQSASSTARAKPVETARLFPPPQILTAAASATAPSRSRGPSDTPPAQMTMFPPPEPLAMDPGPQQTALAQAWRPEPTAKPADGLQVAVLSPAKPPAKPHDGTALRPTAKPREQTLLTSAASHRLQMIYAANGLDVPKAARTRLDSLARDIKTDRALRVQLAAYANGESESSTKARRTSLSRALAVRGFLIDRGIAASRIDVRALGNTSTSGEADRVDVVVLDK